MNGFNHWTLHEENEMISSVKHLNHKKLNPQLLVNTICLKAPKNFDFQVE